MINVRDLMVGSYVLAQGAVWEVRKISPGRGISCRRNEDGWKHISLPVDELQPVPITPEILERLGLNRHYGNNQVYATYAPNVDQPAVIVAYGNTSAETWAKLNLYTEDMYTGSGDYITTIRGVHHLQALIWQLERVFLTLKS